MPRARSIRILRHRRHPERLVLAGSTAANRILKDQTVCSASQTTSNARSARAEPPQVETSARAEAGTRRLDPPESEPRTVPAALTSPVPPPEPCTSSAATWSCPASKDRTPKRDSGSPQDWNRDVSKYGHPKLTLIL